MKRGIHACSAFRRRHLLNDNLRDLSHQTCRNSEPPAKIQDRPRRRALEVEGLARIDQDFGCGASADSTAFLGLVSLILAMDGSIVPF